MFKNGDSYGSNDPENIIHYLLIEHPLNKNENLKSQKAKEMCIEWKDLYKLVETDPILNKNTKWLDASEVETFIKKHKLIYAGDKYPIPAPVPINYNNFNLSGDEARLILTALLSEQMKYSGNMLLFLSNLINRLNEINVNQPPKG